MNKRDEFKALLAPYFKAQYHGDRRSATSYLQRICSPDVVFHLSHPFGDFAGVSDWDNGTFANPLLGIPATGRIASFRFHEFYRIKDGRVVEFQGIWDIPELMMRANAWPMGPALGVGEMTFAPAHQDGLVQSLAGDDDDVFRELLAPAF